MLDARPWPNSSLSFPIERRSSSQVCGNALEPRDGHRDAFAVQDKSGKYVEKPRFGSSKNLESMTRQAPRRVKHGSSCVLLS